MAYDLTDKSIARDDVALDDLSETIKEVVIADDECAAYRCSFLLVLFDYVDVDIVILPELPGERDSILTPRGRAEEEVSSLKSVQLSDCSPGTDILELLVGDAPRNETTCLLWSLISGEV